MTVTTSHGRVSIQDVARQCKVAPSTVSRVLRNCTVGFSVKPEVRERIVQAAATMGYRPNLAVRSIRSKQTKLIALVGVRPWSQSTPGVIEHALTHVVQTINERGYNVCTNFMTGGHAAHELPSWRVDGAVAAYVDRPEDVDLLERSGLPYVSLDGHYGPNGSAVLVDDYGGGCLAVEHLLELGHVRIAYANLPCSGTHPSVADRHRAYRQTLAKRGLPPIADELRVLAGGQERTEAAERFVAHAVVKLKATAVLVHEHLLAVEMLGALHRRGIAVPGQVSIACFNDLFPCGQMLPALTAVALPDVLMGRTAADLLLARLEPDADGVDPMLTGPRRVTLPETLVPRASTARPPR